MIGEGDARFRDERMPAKEALKKAGLEPIVLAAKEGTALINGTQVSTALALSGLFGAHRALQNALIAGALSTDAVMSSTAPFHDEIHLLRGHRGQRDAARTLRTLLTDSNIRQSHLEDDTRVQDPYCIRCQPQVTGAALDLIRQVLIHFFPHYQSTNKNVPKEIITHRCHRCYENTKFFINFEECLYLYTSRVKLSSGTDYQKRFHSISVIFTGSLFSIHFFLQFSFDSRWQRHCASKRMR